ncbi:Protein of uncharacterised function (DUF1120) [Buttiauxella agrestis]|uniref:Protein of uncharacterized function (DUF1120) n=1 Tax=Buttiauxella agrestis TaxID=82977 RepID=A0A381KNL6_9ENTR|nr:DUF1120 domain-containing protein [Buttiauxella agrestis]SUY92953.1 Protein of uncharacterised function (DUF1120) [Buttiauxella agrestis]
MNGKLSSKLIITTMLAGSMSAAMAQSDGPSGELTVKGTYTPPACTVSLGGNGTIDYGHISSASLEDSTSTSLPIKTLANAVTVTCPDKAGIELSVIDNRASSTLAGTDAKTRAALLPGGLGSDEVSTGATPILLGLGSDSVGKPVGNYVANFNNATVDGKAAYFSDMSMMGMGGAVAGTTGYLSKPIDDWAQYYTRVVGADGASVSGNIFTMDYSVQAAIAPKETLDTSSDINLDGLITLTVSYI